jgi:DNA-binding GntR family transcriptional regulator
MATDSPALDSQLQPIEEGQKTITAIVQDRIRSAILALELAPGSRLDQVGLAQSLAVSLVPIREALKGLEAEGFIQIIPRRGAFVTQISIRDIEDLYFSRQIIEGGAAFYAVPLLSEADLDRLQALCNQMDQTLVDKRFTDFFRLNRDFHFTIYNRVPSQYLLNMITAQWELAERYRSRYVMLQDRGATIQQEHRAIVGACYARDAENARTQIVHHLNQTLHGIRDYVPQPPTAAQAKTGSK